ncbi:MAG: hypothetical protein M3R45_09955 [Pseudomonadota bacterium]|nr:hypothetical protein [Pseudomonadota bacterium]
MGFAVSAVDESENANPEAENDQRAQGDVQIGNVGQHRAPDDATGENAQKEYETYQVKRKRNRHLDSPKINETTLEAGRFLCHRAATPGVVSALLPESATVHPPA